RYLPTILNVTFQIREPVVGPRRTTGLLIGVVNAKKRIREGMAGVQRIIRTAGEVDRRADIKPRVAVQSASLHIYPGFDQMRVPGLRKVVGEIKRVIPVSGRRRVGVAMEGKGRDVGDGPVLKARDIV